MGDISEAAREKARQLMTRSFAGEDEPLAAYIQQVSDALRGLSQYDVQPESWQALAPFILPEPVDPLLIEAREIVATKWHNWPDSPWHLNQAERVRNGDEDTSLVVMSAYEGLKRGMDLAK